MERKKDASMNLSPKRFGFRLKQLVVSEILEPLLPLNRLQNGLAMGARLVVWAHQPFVISITGSVGKSTTTAMLAAVLSHPEAEPTVGAVGATCSNMNDDVGVPATLLRFGEALELPFNYPGRLAFLGLLAWRIVRLLVGRYPKVMVLECGTDGRGNFARAISIAPPDVAVVTSIGAAHLERLGTLENVAREKGALVRAVAPDGLVILGQGHAYVAQLQQSSRARVVQVAGKGVELSRQITRVVCEHLSVPQAAVEQALSEFKSPAGRLTRLDLFQMTVIDDTYNANPLSMKLGLDTLVRDAKPGCRRVAVLGVMAELGDEAASYHQAIGDYAKARVDLLVGVGPMSRNYGPDVWFEDSDVCADGVAALLQPNDCLLVKGSASARMGQVVQRLCDFAQQQNLASAT
jgi:UDP-N-acetylmuramoyl-tripeptide--D-alanyl-D-alanine ligase